MRAEETPFDPARQWTHADSHLAYSTGNFDRIRPRLSAGYIAAFECVV